MDQAASSIWATPGGQGPPPPSQHDAFSAKGQKSKTPVRSGWQAAIGFLDPYSSALPIIGSEEFSLVDVGLTAVGAYYGWKYGVELFNWTEKSYVRFGVAAGGAIIGHGLGRWVLEATKIYVK